MIDYREEKSQAIQQLLDAADALQARIADILAGTQPYPTERAKAAHVMALLAMEHGIGFRALMAGEMPSAAMPLLRIQFEALTRSIWTQYAATDAQAAELMQPLTPQSLEVSRKYFLPMDMIEALNAVPAAHKAAAILQRFVDVSRKPLNSFVHAEIFAFQRHIVGYSPEFVDQLLRNSNSLTMMTAMSLAILTGRPDRMSAMAALQLEFAHAFTSVEPL